MVRVIVRVNAAAVNVEQIADLVVEEVTVVLQTFETVIMFGYT